MNNLNIVEALSQVAREKNVDREMVIETLTDALVSAAKKRYGNTENYEVEIDPTQKCGVKNNPDFFCILLVLYVTIFRNSQIFKK